MASADGSDYGRQSRSQLISLRSEIGSARDGGFAGGSRGSRRISCPNPHRFDVFDVILAFRNNKAAFAGIVYDRRLDLSIRVRRSSNNLKTTRVLESRGSWNPSPTLIVCFFGATCVRRSFNDRRCFHRPVKLYYSLMEGNRFVLCAPRPIYLSDVVPTTIYFSCI
jgi:hypothetical protein